ncbi:MAG: FAD-binding protein [Burkholderiales bacterium]|nr:FAD-binding protein [Burkholderiales bacterium]OJX08374.1 MAG: electron transfer flavoprotein subunit alpha [Burkholderiales bacterium 70-64]
MTVLIVAEHDNVALAGPTLNAVSAAARCGDELHILVAGHRCAGAAASAAGIPGVAKILVADAPHLEYALAEEVAAQVLALASNFTHILAPATALGKSYIPRVAARLDVAQISDVSKIVGPDTFERAIYAGNAVVTVQSGDPIKVVTVRSTGFDAAPTNGGCATVESIQPAAEAGISRLLSEELTKSARPELNTAKSIVSGGRGLGSGENYRKVLEPLADKLGAALGASRAAVDLGFVSNDLQIGQTGKIVAPQLYLAVGISGAMQHLAGMKDSKVIVAINKDPEAPIFEVADYGIVGDLFEVVPELVAELSSREAHPV